MKLEGGVLAKRNRFDDFLLEIILGLFWSLLSLSKHGQG